MRKPEYFTPVSIPPQHNNACVPPVFYRQERDWTCSVACIRTMMSGLGVDVPPENSFIEKYAMTPGPYYSRDIKARGMLSDVDALYGCDRAADLSFVNFLLGEGWYVMVESMYNYAHWMVLLGYFVTGQSTDPEQHRLLLYDPYYDRTRSVIADEFNSMWVGSGGDGVERDFIAVRKKR